MPIKEPLTVTLTPELSDRVRAEIASRNARRKRP